MSILFHIRHAPTGIIHMATAILKAEEVGTGNAVFDIRLNCDRMQNYLLVVSEHHDYLEIENGTQKPLTCLSCIAMKV